MAQKLPKMAQNYPKWPKYDARIYALFPQIFFTEKAVPQIFSLLECMSIARIDEEKIQYELVKSRNCNMLHPFPSEQLLCWKLQPVGTLVQVGEAGMVKKEMALCQKPI